MRMVAILKNNDHPEYGEVSMPLPIKASEYGHCMELLSSLGIGDALNKDCQVEELTRAYPTLRCLEGCKVNIDELDYLAKRLDGFDAVEISQFQAMADKLKLTDMKDLITLTRKSRTWTTAAKRCPRRLQTCPLKRCPPSRLNCCPVIWTIGRTSALRTKGKPLTA
ncbi:hypothetical protein ACEVJL_13675 [Pseudoflavonifractor sp. P01025]|uniref:hypothetical protein n=1 Tax=Flintibacter porci TaxID=3342383 RepID=UPI0035B67CC1